MAKVTKKQQVIEFIKAAGPKGLTFGEIQRFIVEKLNGLNYDEMSQANKWDTENPPVFKRKNRGYWCVPLLGDHAGWSKPKAGILESYCTKTNDRYVYDEYKSGLNKFIELTN